MPLNVDLFEQTSEVSPQLLLNLAHAIARTKNWAKMASLVEYIAARPDHFLLNSEKGEAPQFTIMVPPNDGAHTKHIGIKTGLISALPACLAHFDDAGQPLPKPASDAAMAFFRRSIQRLQEVSPHRWTDAFTQMLTDSAKWVNDARPIQLLIDHGAHIEPPQSFLYEPEKDPFLLAVKNGHMASAQALLSRMDNDHVIGSFEAVSGWRANESLSATLEADRALIKNTEESLPLLDALNEKLGGDARWISKRLFHLNVHLVDHQESWNGPWVDALLGPPNGPVQKALTQECERLSNAPDVPWKTSGTSPYVTPSEHLAIEMLEWGLKSHCTPLLKALDPLVQRSHESPLGNYHGLEAAVGFNSIPSEPTAPPLDNQRPSRKKAFQQTVDALVDAGHRLETSTNGFGLLHHLASKNYDNVSEKLIALLDKGLDPNRQAGASAIRPVDTISNPDKKQAWSAIVASHQARLHANHLLDDIQRSVPAAQHPPSQT